MGCLRAALRRLQAAGQGVNIVAVSPVYQSPHMGLEPGDAERYPPHLNCVAQIETTLPPEALLARVQAVEAAGGRQRTLRWGPRTIDIDILLYGDRTLRAENLTLPHPGLAGRAFVVLPLADLAPNLRLPDGRAVAELRNSETIRAQPIEWFAPPALEEPGRAALSWGTP
jgi:2-amino-4-hydroxy-6-hydroxymethyldihydropteridine diphosphokinase